MLLHHHRPLHPIANYNISYLKKHAVCQGNITTLSLLVQKGHPPFKKNMQCQVTWRVIPLCSVWELRIGQKTIYVEFDSQIYFSLFWSTPLKKHNMHKIYLQLLKYSNFSIEFIIVNYGIFR